MLHINQSKILELAKKENLADLTLQEIAIKSGIGSVSKQLISFHIEKLKMKGYLNAQGDVMQQNPTLVSVPFYGSANAGKASFLAQDQVQGYLKVSKSLLNINTNDIFCIRASGNSMNKEYIGDRPIRDGDYIVVKKIQNPVDNDVVVTLVEGLINIKKYRRLDKETVVLISNSTEDYPPIYLTAKDNPHIAGKVVKVLGAVDIS